MTHTLSLVLFTGACAGLMISTLSLLLLLRARRRRTRPRTFDQPPISILKPLCGIDDELEKNLASFLVLDYPRYEVLLGVRDTSDPAYPLARDLARRAPDRVRVILQRGSPGLNPKVNQLVTLERAARHGLLVISDSNIRVPTDYLQDIAEAFCDREVAMVTHAISGAGGQTLGARLDNLHMGTLIGPAIFASASLPRTLVVGKSLALYRGTLARIGGFAAFADFLAEDYVMGRAIQRTLKRTIAVGRVTVENITVSRSVAQFYDRYRRWAVMHRQAIGTPLYAAELLLLPVLLAAIAFATSPSWDTFASAFAIFTAKFTLDAITLVLLDGRAPSSRLLYDAVVKELVLFAAWIHGLTHQHVNWRGNRLFVERGTRMRPITTTAAASIESEQVAA